MITPHFKVRKYHLILEQYKLTLVNCVIGAGSWRRLSMRSRMVIMRGT